MARAEPETMSHAEQDAPAVGPESPAGALSAAASLLLGAATGGRGARGFTRGLPRLSNAGVQALARAALARETAAAPAEFATADDVASALVREAHDESLLRADTITRAFKYLDKAGIGDMQAVFTRTERQGGFQRLVDMVEFPPEGTDKPRLRVAVLAGATAGAPRARCSRSSTATTSPSSRRPIARTSWAGSGWRPAP